MAAEPTTAASLAAEAPAPASSAPAPPPAAPKAVPISPEVSVAATPAPDARAAADATDEEIFFIDHKKTALSLDAVNTAFNLCILRSLFQGELMIPD